MTKREAAIVSAYTGYLIGEFSDFQAYAEEIMGRPIFTHEFPSIADELNEKSKKDFMSIKIGNENKKKEEFNMGCKFKDRCPSYSGWCEGIDEPNVDCISDILAVYENEKKRTKDLEWIYHHLCVDVWACKIENSVMYFSLFIFAFKKGETRI